MASAIQTVCGNHIVRLGSPLIVGIRLHGTIAHIGAANVFTLKARPYLKYLADTLQHLHCDVTLLVSTNRSADSHLITQFAALDFPIPFRLLHDQNDLAKGNRKTTDVSSKNYMTYFRGVAESHGTSTDRVLFIDSEINYRFTPVQTLVLETFVPTSRRQQRQAIREKLREQQRKAEHQNEEQEQAGKAPWHHPHAVAPLASLSVSQPYTSDIASGGSSRRSTSSAPEPNTLHPEERAELHREQQRRRDVHQKEVRRQLDAVRKASQFLEEEHRFADTLPEPLVAQGELSSGYSLEDHGSDDGAQGHWLGRHDARRRDVTRPNAAIDVGEDTNTESRKTLASSTRGAGSNGNEDIYDKCAEKGRRENALGGRHPCREGFTEENYAAAAAALAINLEDYTLVAVADMITQLASSDIAVRDFLRTEPLIEKLRVPFHGVANYLPIENCDFIEVLDWERIKVEKAARDAEVPDVDETEEHKDFFK